MPAASGGPKWIILDGLDRVLFGEFLADRTRPLHLVGSSIGAWRLACLAQKDPIAALDRLRKGYFSQRYTSKPSPQQVSRASDEILGRLLGDHGTEEILSHPWARLHVITARARGLFASEKKNVQSFGLAFAAAGNFVSRRALALSLERVVFHTSDSTPFADWHDLPTRHLPLTRENLRGALLATGSIPLVLEGVRFPGGPAGVFRDGGVADYHLDLDFEACAGLVLYPHFFPYVVPGWFDKPLAWRRARSRNFRRALVIAPSPAVIERLPGRKIPDRGDFRNMSDDERLKAWRAVLAESARMGDELRELLATGRVAERAEPFG
jgi:hypothetical protein